MKKTRTARRPHPFAMAHAYFLMIFLVLFPKGGIKAGGTPLTWGYLYLALSSPFLAVVRLLAVELRFRVTTLAVIGLLIPMQVLLGYAYFTYGFENAGYSISMATGFALMPFIFLLVYPPFFHWIDPDRLSRCFRACILIAAVWGIFLFFLHPFTGHYIEIPYLTVNAADYGLLEATKFNTRGFYLKLIATYNNGNLYGVATLILLPMYNVLEPARWKRGVVLSALLLTLSRTVWVGLVLLEATPLFLLLLKQAKTFPVLYLGSAARRVFALVVMVGLVLSVLSFATNSGLTFLLDSSLGGRAGEFPSFREISLLPLRPLVGFDESLYGSSARFYGWAGLISFTMIMLSPTIMLIADQSALRSKERMAAYQGLVLYSIVAASDGAFVLIPVMAFYWFAYTVFLHGWPGRQARPLAAAAKPVTYLKPSLLLEPS